MWKRYFLQAEAGDAGGTGGGGAGADTGAGGGGSDTVSGGTGGESSGGGSGDSGAGGGANGGKDTGKGFSTDNWREILAKGDPKKIERLSRYAAPEMVTDALLGVQERISRGELRSNVPFPEKGTAEEQANWRQEQGIPPTPDKYELKLPDGMAVQDKDKALIGDLLAKVHSRNASPAVASAVVEAYYELTDKLVSDTETRDKELQQQTRDNLIAEMGLPEFKANMNMVEGLIETMPASVKDLFKTARLGDGTPLLGGNPDVFKGLADWARKINPASAIVKDTGAGMPASIDAQIAKYDKMMREDRATWNKDAEAQKHYQQLVTARDSLKK